ncbi:hypothetical protein WN943_020892 [Citrus x changshan-huyou]
MDLHRKVVRSPSDIAGITVGHRRNYRRTSPECCRNYCRTSPEGRWNTVGFARRSPEYHRLRRKVAGILSASPEGRRTSTGKLPNRRHPPPTTKPPFYYIYMSTVLIRDSGLEQCPGERLVALGFESKGHLWLQPNQKNLKEAIPIRDWNNLHTYIYILLLI